jgi:hypothetical protein
MRRLDRCETAKMAVEIHVLGSNRRKESRKGKKERQAFD